MEDEVDRLVAAWRRERPDLDVEPLEVLSRVSRLARHLDRARRTAFAEFDLAVGGASAGGLPAGPAAVGCGLVAVE
ncbi:hypothetical protein ACIQOV_09320, partial [Kitasatospora sp. NPDC091257]